jgi:hypothetical protein
MSRVLRPMPPTVLLEEPITAAISGSCAAVLATPAAATYMGALPFLVTHYLLARPKVLSGPCRFR